MNLCKNKYTYFIWLFSYHLGLSETSETVTVSGIIWQYRSTVHQSIKGYPDKGKIHNTVSDQFVSCYRYTMFCSLKVPKIFLAFLLLLVSVPFLRAR